MEVEEADTGKEWCITGVILYWMLCVYIDYVFVIIFSVHQWAQ